MLAFLLVCFCYYVSVLFASLVIPKNSKNRDLGKNTQCTVPQNKQLPQSAVHQVWLSQYIHTSKHSLIYFPFPYSSFSKFGSIA